MLNLIVGSLFVASFIRSPPHEHQETSRAQTWAAVYISRQVCECSVHTIVLSKIKIQISRPAKEVRRFVSRSTPPSSHHTRQSKICASVAAADGGCEGLTFFGLFGIGGAAAGWGAGQGRVGQAPKTQKTNKTSKTSKTSGCNSAETGYHRLCSCRVMMFHWTLYVLRTPCYVDPDGRPPKIYWGFTDSINR